MCVRVGGGHALSLLACVSGHRGEPSFLCGDKPKGGPIEFAVTTRDTRDQPVADHAHGRHWSARPLGLGKSQTYILQYERQDESGRVGLLGDLFAINLMRTPAEHR